MAGKNEDTPPQLSYPYFWSAESGSSLDEFITKYRPSMVQNDGTKPWLWVQAPGATCVDDKGREAAMSDAANLLDEYAAKVESVKNDESIPVRSNKKKGTKSKKEVREQLQAEATDKLKEIATKHNYFTGKWLMFASPDRVDSIWAALAKSLVSGPLAASSAKLAKVSTSPQAETPSYQHVICLYLPNVYDKDDVTAVMKILLRSHGFRLNGVKSDLYTLIGLDSKHPSGIPSTIWKNTAIMTDAEMSELRDAFFAEAKTTKDENAARETTGGAVESKNQEEIQKNPKPKTRLKKVEDDPFASDDDQPSTEYGGKRKLRLQYGTGNNRSEADDDDDDAADPPPKKKKT